MCMEFKSVVEEQIIQGVVHDIHVSEPVVYVDNQARNRSGHMSHAMVELSDGRIIDFNSNCSAERYFGHTPFGWIEYRYSDDGGASFGDVYDLKIRLTIDPQLQRERILERPEFLQKRFFEEWIPMEDRYFEEFQISRKCHMVL